MCILKKSFFIHLDVSIELLMFDLLYPIENTNYRFAPSFMDGPCTNAHFSQLS